MPPNLDAAIEWYQKAKEYPLALVKLGSIFSTDNHGRKDIKKAAQIFETVAFLSHPSWVPEFFWTYASLLVQSKEYYRVCVDVEKIVAMKGLSVLDMSMARSAWASFEKDQNFVNIVLKLLKDRHSVMVDSICYGLK